MPRPSDTVDYGLCGTVGNVNYGNCLIAGSTCSDTNVCVVTSQSSDTKANEAYNAKINPLIHQCKNKQDYTWRNNHGHTCVEIASNPDAQDDWIDDTGMMVTDFCISIGGRLNTNCD